MIEIETVGHQFRFESRAVMMHLVVDVDIAGDGDRMYRYMFPLFVAY